MATYISALISSKTCPRKKLHSTLFLIPEDLVVAPIIVKKKHRFNNKHSFELLWHFLFLIPQIYNVQFLINAIFLNHQKENQQKWKTVPIHLILKGIIKYCDQPQVSCPLIHSRWTSPHNTPQCTLNTCCMINLYMFCKEINKDFHPLPLLILILRDNKECGIWGGWFLELTGTNSVGVESRYKQGRNAALCFLSLSDIGDENKRSDINCDRKFVKDANAWTSLKGS